MSQDSFKAHFFLTRSNGSMVPLVAMDELPTTITIRNVPRLLSPHDTSGMTGVGTFEARHLKHTVDFPTANNQTLLDRSLMGSKFAGFEHHLNRPGITALTYEGPPKAFGIQEQAPSPASQSPTPYTPSRSSTPIQDRIDRITSPHAQQPLPPWHDPSALPKPAQNAPGVKEYCSFWLRRGECDYAQQGCLYKHEMPLDLETLNRLGHTDIPEWYRRKHRLGSYHAVSVTNSYLGASTATPSNANTPQTAKKNIFTGDWRKGATGQNNRQSDVEGTRASFECMMSSSSKSRRTQQDPTCPPSTPQIATKSIFPRSESPNIHNTPTANLPYYTLQQGQNHATLEQCAVYEAEQNRKMIDAFGPRSKIKALGLYASDDNSGERPSTGSSTSSRDVAGTPATSASTPETSDGEVFDLLSDDAPTPTTTCKSMATLTPEVGKPKMSPARPVMTMQAVKTPKANTAAAASHTAAPASQATPPMATAKTYAAKKKLSQKQAPLPPPAKSKARARKVRASVSDGSKKSVASELPHANSLENQSIVESEEMYQGYDHDD